MYQTVKAFSSFCQLRLFNWSLLNKSVVNQSVKITIYNPTGWRRGIKYLNQKLFFFENPREKDINSKECGNFIAKNAQILKVALRWGDNLLLNP